jgi:hypothetical protein
MEFTVAEVEAEVMGSSGKCGHRITGGEDSALYLRGSGNVGILKSERPPKWCLATFQTN